MQQLPCQVVAAVPRAAADAAAAAAGVDPRRSSPFISFAQIAAAEVRQGFDVDDSTRFIAAVVLAAAWYRIHQPAAGLHLRGRPRMLLPWLLACPAGVGRVWGSITTTAARVAGHKC
jgi:hypothetical protein